jgi:hypothetical protein
MILAPMISSRHNTKPGHSPGFLLNEISHLPISRLRQRARFPIRGLAPVRVLRDVPRRRRSG